MTTIVGQLVVSFSEEAYQMFDAMFTEIEKKGMHSPNSKLLDDALSVVCAKYGYGWTNRDAFWNAYLCWDVARSY